MQNALLSRAAKRLRQAHAVITALDLFDRWSIYGQPMLVGAAAYGLLVAPDIDVEIYCPQPEVAIGFRVVSDLAELPGIWKVRFSNELEGADQGLYWQVRYRDADTVWKLDMWLLADNHPGPQSAVLIAPLRAALTRETRAAILGIKEALLGQQGIHSIDIYRAVLDDGVRTPDDFTAWRASNPAAGLSSWRPGSPPARKR